MERTFIYPWHQKSLGARAVARAAEAKILLRKNSRYEARDGDVIINWGGGDIRNWINGHLSIEEEDMIFILNEKTHRATNKLEFFRATEGSPYVPAWTDRPGAALNALNYPVVCRTKLTGKDGDGIVIANNLDELVPAKLYVEYKKKTAEYRIHVGRLPDGTVTIFAAQQKLRPRNVEIENPEHGFRVRNYGAGFRFFYTVNDKPVIDHLPLIVRKAAEDVFLRFPELTFGAMDIIYHQPSGEAYVLEINTAPGQCPKTSEHYADFFKKWAETREQMRAPLPVEVDPNLNDFQEWFYSQDNQDHLLPRKKAFLAGWKAAMERFQ